jgi:hypothetical protein
MKGGRGGICGVGWRRGIWRASAAGGWGEHTGDGGVIADVGTDAWDVTVGREGLQRQRAVVGRGHRTLVSRRRHGGR